MSAPSSQRPPESAATNADQQTIIANLGPSESTNPPRPNQSTTDLPTIVAQSDSNAATLPAYLADSTRPTVNAATTETLVAAPAKDDLVDQVWGDFRFAGLLGRGGMGAVYRGQQVSLNRPVAIKVLPPHLSGNEGFRARFELEAKAVAQINSPHVIQVYGAGVHQGHHYFAMEYVEGSDLSARLKQGERPTQRQSLDWVTQAARGLAAAGEHGIVHRDIKPGNMMLTKKSMLKLMDFGLVKLASEGHHLTQTGTIMGTVTYFSPEQGRGDPCDCRTDIYALGVVFYELLAGRIPFTGQDATSIIYQHIHVLPTPPKAFAPETPDDWQAVVMKCLQKDAAARYATAADLVTDLERLGRGQAPNLPPAELAALRRGLVPGGASSSTRPLGLWIGLGSVLAVAAGLTVWLAVRPSAAQPLTAPTALAATPAPTSQPTAQVVKPSTPIDVAMVDAPARLRSLIAEGRWQDARNFSLEQARLQPTEPIWKQALITIDQGETDELLTRGRRALAEGTLPVAEQYATQAAVLNPEAAKPLTADIAAARAARERKTAAITTAEGYIQNNRHADAEAILVLLAAKDPNDAQVATLLAEAKAARQTKDQAAQEAQTKLQAGQAALAKHDHEGAKAAYSAALANPTTGKAAQEGLTAVEASAQRAAIRRTELTNQLATRDFAAAQTTLIALREDAPAAMLASAEADLAQAKLRDEEHRRANEEQDARRTAQAKAVLALIDDPKSTIPELESALARFTADVGPGRPEQPLIERRIEDRRQSQALVGQLADLDRNVLTGDQAGIAQRVLDQDFAGSLAALSRYPGLAFTSRLGSFSRDGDQATAQVIVRHALAVFPERELRYLYELKREAAGWRIAAAHLQP